MTRNFEQNVANVMNNTKPGDVLAYSEVALEAGYPGAARAVGNLLKNREDLPWHRVVTVNGRLSPKHAKQQAELLENEGVIIKNGHIKKPGPKTRK